MEALFYFLFPFLMPKLERTRPRTLGAALVACWFATFVLPALYGIFDPDHLHRPFALGDEVLWGWYLKFAPWQRVPEFVAGMVAALLVERSPRSAGFSSVMSVAAVACVGALAALTIPKLVPYAYLHSGVLLPIYVLLIAALASSTSALAWCLARAPIVALGRASYATYILHVPLFMLLAKFDPALWTTASHVALYFAALLALSLAAHRWFEEPLRRALRTRLARR